MSVKETKLPYCPGAWASVYATRDVVKDAQYHLFFEDFTMAPTICGLERERHWPIMSLPLARESACAECVQRFKNCIFGETEQSQDHKPQYRITEQQVYDLFVELYGSEHDEETVKDAVLFFRGEGVQVDG